MPKAKRRGKAEAKATATAGPSQASQAGAEMEEEIDSSSVISMDSVESTLSELAGAVDNGVDESSAAEDFEDKLRECIDGLSEKSVNTRTKSLQTLTKCFRVKMVGDLLESRRDTTADALERCLKKGKTDEKILAADCLSLLCLQLGSGVDTETVFQQVQPALTTHLNDGATHPKARAAIASCMALCQTLALTEAMQLQELMTNFERIFSKSYVNDEGVAPVTSPDVSALHAACVNGWCLLLAVAPNSLVMTLADLHLPRMCALLGSASVDLRVAAGEAVALIYELARDIDEDFEGPMEFEVCQTLKALATESTKSKAKKDKKIQKSSFRDILKTVEDADSPYLKIKFGTELLEIDSWTHKRYYGSLCGVLTTGMSKHLQVNELVRDIFGLGAPLPTDTPFRKKEGASRYERHLANAAISKIRDLHRAKGRGKRTASFD